jgi:hypothetical protein
MLQLPPLRQLMTCSKQLDIVKMFALEIGYVETITTALIAAMFFNGNQSAACNYMKDHNLILRVLEKSRFLCPSHTLRERRLYNLYNYSFCQAGKKLPLFTCTKKGVGRLDYIWQNLR